MKTARRWVAWALAASAMAAAATGCELIASVDDSQLEAGGGAAASGGGSPTTTTTTTTTGTGGTGGTGGAGVGGTGGTGGAGSGGGPACVDPTEDCLPTGAACVVPICDADGMCTTMNLPEDQPLPQPQQMFGDCKVIQCDGAGNTKTVIDNSDTGDDGKLCTVETCDNGTPVHTPNPEGTACAEIPNGVCTVDGLCVVCVNGDNCASHVCQGNVCVAATCADGVKNGTETDVDCGGNGCGACDDPLACMVAADCKSKVCTLDVCQAPLCTDGVKNGQETDLDCGGADCDPCDDTLKCAIDADCSSDVCVNLICQAATCGDGHTNHGETDVDCGGGACPATCDTNKHCNAATDCTSGVCDMALHTCKAPACGDGVTQMGEACDDGNASNTDACLTTCVVATCGDTFLHAGVEQCDDGNQVNTDACTAACNTATCGDNILHIGVEQCDDGNQTNTDACTNGCMNPTCADGILNQGENGVDCGGPCGSCPGISCANDGTCASLHCVDGICCNAACSGLCQACSTIRTGGANGTCLAVTAGTDPDNECAGVLVCSAASTCQ